MIPTSNNIVDAEMKRNALMFDRERRSAQIEIENILTRNFGRLEALIAANNETLLRHENRIRLVENTLF